MRVISRKTRNGDSIGYLIELDAGLNAIVPERSLYDESIVAELIEAGYKYTNYQGDIKGPDGINVKDLVADEVDESKQEDSDAMTLYDDFNDILTEQQMQKFITFDVGSLKTVNFREPIKVLYKTHAELLQYLRQFSQGNRQVLDVFDLFPVNAFCSQEALFTLQERIDNANDFYDAMRLIEKRRVFRDKVQLIMFLDKCAELGVIEKKDKYTDVDFLNAYNAWGPEGLNVNVVDMRMHFDVISNILNTGVGATDVVQTLSEHIGVIRTKTANELSTIDDYLKSRTLINVPMDKEGNIYIDGEAYPANKVISKSSGNIIIDEKQKTTLVVANRQSISSKKPYTLFVKDPKTGINSNITVSKYEGRPMLAMVIMSDTGAMYKYKMDYRLSVVVNDKDVIYIGRAPEVCDVMGRKFNIRTVLEDNFQLDLMMHQMAADMIRGKVIKPVYQNTIKMLLESGITFEGAMDYCAAMNCVSTSTGVKYLPLTSISRTFRKWFPEWFVSIFIDDQEQVEEIANASDEEKYDALYALYYGIKDKLNDASWDVLTFCNPMWMSLKDKAFDENNFIYKRCSLELGWDPDTLRSHMFEEATEQYINKIDMLVSFMESSVLLHQGIGRKEDEKIISQWTKALYEVISSIFKAEKFSETVSDFEVFKDKLLSNEYFDVDEFLPVIANEAEGCLQDKGLLYGSLFSQTENIAVQAKGRGVPTPATGAIVVDSVFKEYSLAPSKDRRDIIISGIRFKLYNDVFRKTEPTRIMMISERLVSSVIDQFIDKIKAENMEFLRTKIMDIYCRNATTDCLKMVISVILGADKDKWQVDQAGNHVIVRKNYPMSIYYNKTIDISYVIGPSDWDYLVNNAGAESSRIAIPLWEYAYGYYSFSGNKMAWNDVVLNADITPWHVTPKKGWNAFTVYNGPLNLIPNNTWLTAFKQQGYFKPVNDKGGRAPYDLVQLLMSGEQCNCEDNVDINAIYKMRAYAKEKGVPETAMLNQDIADFYIDEDAGFESVLDYKVRYMAHIKNAPAGKVLYKDVLMSDKFFGLFAKFYGEEVSLKPEYRDAGTYPHIFINNCNEGYVSKSFAPYTISSQGRNILIEGSVHNGVKIKRTSEVRFSLDILCKNKDYVYGNFVPKCESVLIYPILTFARGENNMEEYDLTKMTVEDLVRLAQEGMCYQIDLNNFYVKAITGDYIIEA